MAGNFNAMPPLLKLFTLMGLGAPVFLVMPLLRRTTVVLGRPMSTGALWSSGSAPLVVLGAIIMGLSAVLMLKRSRRGIGAYVLGWMAMIMSSLVMAYTARAKMPDAIGSAVFNSIAATAMWLYLWRSAAVRRYFDGGL